MGTSSYEGAIAIVTGGASGIGRALSQELVHRGAEVIVADRQREMAQETAAGIGSRARAHDLDVRDRAAFDRLAHEVIERHGRIDFLFNNAGIAVGGEMEHYRPEDWDDVFDVNLRGVAYGIAAVYPHMIRQRSGHIVNTASVAGLIPGPLEGSYCATKHAVVGLTKSLRIEGKRHGVRVSALCPGAIRTPILTGGKYGRIDVPDTALLMKVWERARPMDPNVFAHAALDRIARNEALIVLPSFWKAFWYLDRISPSLSMRVASALGDRIRAEVFPR